MKKEIEKVKKWIIENIECDLSSYTYPIIKKATEKNIIKAIKQNKCYEDDISSGDYQQLQNLKEDLEIFNIIKKWK